MRKTVTDYGDYFVGWQEIDVCGFYTEELLNAVKNENIEIWDIRKINQCRISFKIHSFSSEKLFEIADSTQSLREMEITVKKTEGLIEDILKYKLRSGILAGAVFSVVMFIIMSSFIWKIEISGLVSYPEENLLSTLAENGIYVGALNSGHDLPRIRYSIMHNYDKIAYITINVKGSKVQVEVDESTVPPEKDGSAPGNIFAKRDGQILLIEAYKGIPQVENFQAVRKGQLLVSGVYNSKVIGYRLVHSDAKILARTRRTYTEFCPFESTETIATGESDKFYALKIFGISVNLSFFNKVNYEYFESVSEEKELCIGENIVLPISLVTTVLYEQELESVSYDEESAKEYISSVFDETLRIDLHGLEIEEAETAFSVTDEGVCGVLDCTVIEDICHWREIEVETKD